LILRLAQERRQLDRDLLRELVLDREVVIVRGRRRNRMTRRVEAILLDAVELRRRVLLRDVVLFEGAVRWLAITAVGATENGRGIDGIREAEPRLEDVVRLRGLAGRVSERRGDVACGTRGVGAREAETIDLVRDRLRRAIEAIVAVVSVVEELTRRGACRVRALVLINVDAEATVDRQFRRRTEFVG